MRERNWQHQVGLALKVDKQPNAVVGERTITTAMDLRNALRFQVIMARGGERATWEIQDTTGRVQAAIHKKMESRP